MTIKLKQETTEKCIYNPSFYCPNNLKCPLLSVGFVRQIEKWLYTNRTPKSIPLSYRPWQYIPQTDNDWRMVAKANVAAWFPTPEIVMQYFIDDKMTPQVCSELLAGYKKFNAERWRRYNARRKKRIVPDNGKINKSTTPPETKIQKGLAKAQVDKRA